MNKIGILKILLMVFSLSILVTFCTTNDSTNLRKNYKHIRNQDVYDSLKLITIPDGVKINNEITRSECSCNKDSVYTKKDSKVNLNYLIKEYTFDTLVGKTSYTFCYSSIAFSKEDADTMISFIFAPYLEQFRKAKSNQKGTTSNFWYKSYVLPDEKNTTSVLFCVETSIFLGGASSMFNKYIYSIPKKKLSDISKKIILNRGNYSHYLIDEFHS